MRPRALAIRAERLPSGDPALLETQRRLATVEHEMGEPEAGRQPPTMVATPGSWRSTS